MIKKVFPTNQFKRDIRKHLLELVTPEWAEVLGCLSTGKELPGEYDDHKLIGNWEGCRDCHVKSDLILIYEYSDDELILHRLGTHSQLFG